jgi:hypothetical protein
MTSASRILRALAPAALLLALSAGAGAQVVTPPPQRGDTAARDTARRDSVPPDDVRIRGITPGGAFLRSVVLPGWGQSSIGASGRGGIYFAAEAGSLWMVYKSSRKLREAEEMQDYLRETGELAEDRLLPLVRDRKAQREDWITMSVFILFFSGADAFVATHLADFDAHVGALPTPDGGVAVGVTVPVGPGR